MHEEVRGVERIMGAAVELPHHYIEAETSFIQGALRSLKHGDAFTVFDEYGDIGHARNGPEGIYFNDTRFLSCYELRFEGVRPLLLSSFVQDDNAALSANLANPDVHGEGYISLPRDTISIERTKFLWEAACYERIVFSNHASDAGDIDDKSVMDAALIAAAQAVEHYEITRYGSLIAWANELGRSNDAALLQQTLEEEKETDRKLTALATRDVNLRAAE